MIEKIIAFSTKEMIIFGFSMQIWVFLLSIFIISFILLLLIDLDNDEDNYTFEFVASFIISFAVAGVLIL